MRSLVARRFELRAIFIDNTFSSRYYRLMALAFTETISTIPLASYILFLNVKEGVYPWKGWSDTHADFSRVEYIPSIEWQASNVSAAALEITRWSTVLCAFAFFVFFGLATDARERYKGAFRLAAGAISHLFSKKRSESLHSGNQREEFPAYSLTDCNASGGFVDRVYEKGRMPARSPVKLHMIRLKDLPPLPDTRQ